MRGLRDAAINRTDAGLNGAFSAVTRVYKTIAAVRKLEVVHRLQAHFQRLAHRTMGQSVGQQGDRDARLCGRTPGKRPVGTIAPRRCAVRRQGHGAERGVWRCHEGRSSPTPVRLDNIHQGA